MPLAFCPPSSVNHVAGLRHVAAARVANTAPSLTTRARTRSFATVWWARGAHSTIFWKREYGARHNSVRTYQNSGNNTTSTTLRK